MCSVNMSFFMVVASLRPATAILVVVFTCIEMMLRYENDCCSDEPPVQSLFGVHICLVYMSRFKNSFDDIKRMSTYGSCCHYNPVCQNLQHIILVSVPWDRQRQAANCQPLQALASHG